MQFFVCYDRYKNVTAILKPDPESTLQCASYEVRLDERPFSAKTMKFLRAVPAGPSKLHM